MSATTSTSANSTDTPAVSTSGTPPTAGKTPLFDISGIDLSKRVLSRQQLEEWKPHRDKMALIDAVVWHSPDFTQAVGIWQVRHDEWWVPGHFPARAMMPGVMMIEAGAQLCVFLFNNRYRKTTTLAFTHINEAVFRGQVVPGDSFYILAQETRFTPRRFIGAIQGVVNGKVVFEASIAGMVIGDTGTPIGVNPATDRRV